MARWGVVGGGVLGLMLAHRLSGQGHEVTLIEGAPELGGLAAAWSLTIAGAGSGEQPDETITWDRHYHVTLLSDRRTQELVGVAGLADDMRWVETKTGYYGDDGTLRSVSNTIEFLQLPGLNPIDKLRLGGTIFYGSKIRNGKRMERIPVDAWLQRWSGLRTFERFWRPLLRAKLGDDYTLASSAFIWATIQRLYAARRSGLKKEMFGYVPGGYARVFDRIAQALTAEGVKLMLGAPVRRVHRDGDRVAVDTDLGTERFDQCVLTTNAHQTADLCPDLTAVEAARLRSVRYMGIVCASLVLRRPLGPYYLTYITDLDSPFTAVVEMTAFVDPSELGGHALVYLPKYVAPDDPLFDASDDEIRASFLAFVKKMYRTFVDDDVLAFRVSRVRRVFAVPTLGYSDRMPPVATSIPGLHVLGSAQLPFATLNVNDTLGLVEELIP
jgi:protoporphyrinogen oxidase